MPFINPSFRRLPEKHKWSWRVAMFLLTALNCWEWFRHIEAGKTGLAVIDAIFVVMALCVIAASFF